MPILAITLSMPLATPLRYACDEILIFFRDWIVQFAIDDRFDRRVLFAFAALIRSVGALGPLQQAFAARVPERLERQVRIDRIGAVADQAGNGDALRELRPIRR